MPEHDTERFRIAASMDDLMIRTIGLMESMPSRISKLEDLVHDIEEKFSFHEGEQGQGIKRLVDRMDSLEKSIGELLKQFEECRRTKPSNDLEDKFKELEEQLTPIKEDIKKLLDDLNSREDTRKTITQYAKEAFISFIRYAMLPFTIVILIIFGMDPSYIPWYTKPNTPVVEVKKSVEEVFWNKVYMNSVTERDIVSIQNQFPHSIITSQRDRWEDALKHYRSQIVTSPLMHQMHIFIWTPSNGQDGKAQVYDKSGRTIGNAVKIVRGI